MSIERSEIALLYFQNAYGPEISEDIALTEFLKSASCQHLAIGERLTQEDFREDEKTILLSGRIRVLKRTDNGAEETLLLLSAGDIWDLRLFERDAASLVISSTEAILCRLSTSLVLENPTLHRHWESTLYRVVHLKQSPLSSVPPLPTISPQTDFGIIVTSPATDPEAPLLTPTRVCLFLNQVFKHYQWPTPFKEDVPEVHSINDMAHILEHHGIRTRKVSLTWAQLLNATYPLILLDEENRFRWITGAQGNTLLETQEGKVERFIPKDFNSQSQYTALFLKPLVSHKASYTSTPFTLGWYVKLCAQNWFLSIQMVISSLLLQVFALGSPLFYIVIFDRVFGHQNLSTLDIMAIGIFILLVFEVLTKLLRSYVLSHQLEFIDKASMEAFLERIFGIPLAKTSAQLTRSFTDRFPEMVKMNQALASTFLLTSLDVAFSALLVAFLLMLHAKLALISLASLLPIALMSFWSTPITKKRAVEFNKDQRTCQLKLTEALENSETIHSLNAGGLLKWRIAEKLEDHLHKGFTSRFDRVAGPIGQNFTANAGSIVTLYFGAHAVLQGEISFGVYMAINMLSRQVIGSVQRLLTSVLQFQEAMETLEQFKSLYQKSEQEEKPSTERGVVLKQISGAVRMVDVRFRYQGDAPWILKDINLEIQPGQKIVITGRSGAGKTTLVRLLQRLYEPASGHITLDGFNLTDMDIGNLRRHVGIALQRPAMFVGTIRDNIALGNPSAPMKAIVEAASLAHLDKDLLQFPKGFETPVAPMGANLSGGQVARIALARIFLMQPSMLILDEALASCDATLNAAIFVQIFEKYKHATCVLITDYLPVHQRADKIIVLHEGQIVEQGTYQDLIRNKGYYSHLHQV